MPYIIVYQCSEYFYFFKNQNEKITYKKTSLFSCILLNINLPLVQQTALLAKTP